ncbi:hypothetical protein H5410_001241 [Solanum commersonii]|uniref:Zinc finger PMZ-type domain-containing protein n=1 Tax=Solanum commersonii TaxID=4109 RepID=A0A9J6AYK2_SOLCO|nr:hypothetical protein H5410_001241 [Solanum commersonii]
MSYFALRDYIKKLGYTIDCKFFIKWGGLFVLVDNDKVLFDLLNMINDRDTIKVYVFHGFVPNVSDSGVGEESFNEASNHNNQPPTSTYPSNPTIGPSETSNTSFEDQPTIVPPSSPYIVPSLSPSSNVPPPPPSTVPLPSCVPSSDPIIDNDPTDDEVEDKSGYKGDTNEDIVVDRDFHPEYIDIRASKRHFKRSQRRSRGTTSYQINVDEKGPNIGYDETNIGIMESLVGKLGGDQPYYLSDEAPSFEIDDETGWGDGEKVDQIAFRRKPQIELCLMKLLKRIAKSTFEAELKDNIQAMKKLGKECLDDLLWFNLDTWCNKYFQDYSKCDVVDNNMAESFNAWILPVRYKTIITMLEEIRVKMMKIIGDLREFSNTWITDISHMSLKILQENIEEERGFEIKHHGFTHTVDVVSRSCSCRSWQLRGIPCPLGVVALHYKELEPINFVASCYSKETYLNTYVHFIQLMNNMKMWPTSNNSIVKPSKIKKMPGRPSKVRRKKANESRKTGKLIKRGVVMTCSKCVGPSQSTDHLLRQEVLVQVSQLNHLLRHSFEATAVEEA